MATSWRSWRKPRLTSTVSPRKSGAPCLAATRGCDMARVLVIEDNAANMRLATFVLESAGHVVLGATDAEIGLTVGRDQLPAVVLIDIRLRWLDGLQQAALPKAGPTT